MKALKMFVLAVVSAVVIAACGGAGGSNTPEAAALGFVKAFSNLDMAGAKKFATAKSGETLTSMEAMMKMAPKEELAEAKKEAAKMKLTKATCKEAGSKEKMTCILCCDENGKDTKEGFTVVKENGKWLVDFSKESMGGGSSEPTEVEPTPPTDTAAAKTETGDVKKEEGKKEEGKKTEEKKK